MKSRVIVTGGDADYHELLMGAVRSVLQLRDVDARLVVLDFGLRLEQRAEIENLGVDIVSLAEMIDVLDISSQLSIRDTAMLARPEIPRLIPGFGSYMWLDSDAWIQEYWAAAVYFERASTADIVVAKERHPKYQFQPRLRLWEWKYLIKGFGLRRGIELCLKPHINAGVFAALGDSPIWACWRDSLRSIFERTGKVAPYDQMALNACVYCSSISNLVLDARYNWICARQRPVLDVAKGTLCLPASRREPIGIVHLAGVSKRTRCQLHTSDGLLRHVDLKFPLTISR